MTKYLLFAVLFSATALAACDPVPEPEELHDQQIVCSLRGEAFVFIDGYEKTVHSVRSVESDPLCQPLKAVIKMNVDPSIVPGTGK
jgi:hypothetical protein